MIFFVTGATFADPLTFLIDHSVRLDIALNHSSNRVVSLGNGWPDRIVHLSSPVLSKQVWRSVDFSPSVMFDLNLLTVFYLLPTILESTLKTLSHCKAKLVF